MFKETTRYLLLHTLKQDKEIMFKMKMLLTSIQHVMEHQVEVLGKPCLLSNLRIKDLLHCQRIKIFWSL